MNAALAAILDTHLVGIIRLKRYESSSEIATALVAGGFTALEFTLSGEGALAAIAAARQAVGSQAHIGAGTVLTPDAVADAAAAGAEFIVTPAVDVRVIAACQQLSLPIACGAFTPTEIMTAQAAGADVVKLFPARIGGPQYVRDLLAPFPDLRLMPTGGVDLSNVTAYLAAGAVAVGIGGNLVSAAAVADRQFAQMTQQARAYVQAVT